MVPAAAAATALAELLALSLEVTARAVVPEVPVVPAVPAVPVALAGRGVVATREPMAPGVPADRAVTLVTQAMAAAVLPAMRWYVAVVPAVMAAIAVLPAPVGQAVPAAALVAAGLPDQLGLRPSAATVAPVEPVGVRRSPEFRVARAVQAVTLARMA